ncbi:MAG TPA: SprT family zinc-dependent metalloprotease [Candidatus Andersenbacteria bacterium]|nr:SprT family zinc-dependent metalloprotease [Candidatus Andersenbacteria bacterium]
MKVQSGLFPFPVVVRRSAKAKRLAIHIEISGDVELVLPKRASEHMGITFLHERKDWIIRTREKQRQSARTIKPFIVRNGEYLPCFGDTLLLELRVQPQRARSFIEEKKGKLIARVSSEEKLMPALSRFYISQANHYFIGQSQEFGEVIKKSISNIRVIDMKTQWGSCNHRTHTLTFNWRLALAPETVARYVAAHEVAHIVHANHSGRFWKLVEKLDPSYAASRAWLKKYGSSLFLK